MRINELTEAPGFLQKAGQAIGNAVASAKQSAQAAMGNPAAQAAQNTDMLGSAAYKQWVGRVAQLTQAASTTPAGVMSKAEYDRNLVDFVAKNMLQKNIDILDATSKSRVLAQLKNVSQNKDDPAKMQQAFKDLAKVTVTSRIDPSKTSSVPVQQKATMNTQQAKSAVDQFLQGGISSQQQQALSTFLQSTAGTPAVKSTGNPVTDALLNRLGIQTR